MICVAYRNWAKVRLSRNHLGQSAGWLVGLPIEPSTNDVGLLLRALALRRVAVEQGDCECGFPRVRLAREREPLLIWFKEVASGRW